MLRKANLLAVLVTLMLAINSAVAQTTVPLNTGYNHSVFGPYPTVNIDPTPTGPNARDNYWINIASFTPTTPAVGPAWNLKKAAPWAAAFANTNWIGARNTASSPPGTAPNNPAYTIFRKCFCLLPGFKEAKLTITSLRADDTVQVWLNTQTNQVIAPAWGNWNTTPLSGGTKQGFRVGKNCVYVLVEDFQGHMGFDLLGDVTAYGLLPMPAAGTNQSFEPCACREGHPYPAAADRADRATARVVSDDVEDGAVVEQILKVAEARRMAKQRIQYQGRPPKP